MKYILVSREIHPIGQGAFYTETFRGICGVKLNVVYDCGTFWDGKNSKLYFTSKKNANHPFLEVIDNFVNGVDGQVDIVFVSHFHLDHINGLKHLLDKTTSNVKLVLPYLDYTQKIYFFISNVNTLGGFSSGNEEFITWLYRFYFGELEGVYKIEVSDDVEPTPNENDRIPHIISSGYDILEHLRIHIDWMYIPIVYVNKNLSSFISDFINELKNSMIIAEAINNITIEKLQNNWEEIQKLYSKAKKKYSNINENDLSLMLYSGNDWNYTSRIISCLPLISYSPLQRTITSSHVPDMNVGCFYTGDMMDPNAFYHAVKVIGALFETIGLIQMSHHGGESDFHSLLPDVYAKYAFCCYGTENHFHHPSWLIMDHFLQNHTRIFAINECSKSGIVQRIIV